MASYKLSELAEDDLRFISSKSIEKWGRIQAKTYVTSLHNTLLQIANTPDIGRSRPELFENAKSFSAQKHIVYYWKSDNGIEVARILHQRMDVLAAFE